MKKILLLFYSLLFCCIAEAQNLVPNPSFEDIVACPTGLSQVYNAVGWFSVETSCTPDYMNRCSSSIGVEVPFNACGYQEPHTGDGYCALISYDLNGPNWYRELIGANLISPMQTGVKYYVSFYTSFGGTCYAAVAIDKIGVLFSTVAYSQSNPAPINNFAHVFATSIITDSVNWTRISGSLIADSNYTFISIGNFFDDSHTDTIVTCPFSIKSFYYVDDICVSTDSLTCNPKEGVGINEIPNHNSEIKIFPNPFHSSFTLNCPLSTVNSQLTIYNCIGEKIFSTYIKSEEQGIELNAAAGVYFLRVGNFMQKLIVY